MLMTAARLGQRRRDLLSARRAAPLLFAALVLEIIAGGCSAPERSNATSPVDERREDGTSRSVAARADGRDERPSQAPARREIAPASEAQGTRARDPSTDAPRVPNERDWERLLGELDEDASLERNDAGGALDSGERTASEAGNDPQAADARRLPPSMRGSRRDPLLDSLENERGDEARASATDTRPARDTATRRSRDDASVDDLLRRLRSGPPEDEEAFREIARAPKRLLPELIRHVSSKEPTRFYEIHALALHDDVVRRDESDDRLYYFVKGMGRFYFDDVAAGLVFGGRGTRVEFRSFRDPFPLGVVLRAALLYRFKSEAYPDFADEERDIARWWRTYYERSEPRL